jgi:hypothetical protein
MSASSGAPELPFGARPKGRRYVMVATTGAWSGQTAFFRWHSSSFVWAAMTSLPHIDGIHRARRARRSDSSKVADVDSGR